MEQHKAKDHVKGKERNELLKCVKKKKIEPQELSISKVITEIQRLPHAAKLTRCTWLS